VYQIQFDDPHERLVSRLLPEQARKNGDSIWLMADGGHCTFDEANTRVERLAGGFSQLGLGQGDAVALMLDSSIEHVLTVLALARIGAITVPINTAYKGRFLRSILETTQPAGVVVGSEYVDVMTGELAELPLRVSVTQGAIPMEVDGARSATVEELLTSNPRVTPISLSCRDAVSVMYTGGTTGRSKGVIQSNITWISGSQFSSAGRGLDEKDRFLSVTPMYHSGAWVIVLYPSLLYGLPVGIEPRFSVSDFWSQVDRYQATQLFTLGAMHMWLWGLPETPEDSRRGVRVWTAVPLPVDLWKPFQDRYGVQVFSAYGQTEIMPLSTAPIGQTFKPGSVGHPRADMEVAVFDDDDQPLPPGEPGELVVRPREPGVVFGGYYRMPIETLETFRDLWYHSGDICRIDSDGELFFVDRKADYLRRRGENISSIEVEDVVRQHPEVAGVAVHSVPADESEDEMKLCVVLVSGSTATPLEIAQYCDSNLPYFAVPRYIELMDDLPITPVGRVQKFVLRQRGVTDSTWDAVAEGFKVTR
jgi:crotonobetaine/carnitine-CoA ligase